MKIGINGVGRIGRQILRILANNNNFQITTINDINFDVRNIEYTIKYDSLYGRFQGHVECTANDKLVLNGHEIKVFCESKIENVDWSNTDYVIDASGIGRNISSAPQVIQKWGVKRVYITNSSSISDFELVLGVNEKFADKCHKVVSCSICDTTALAPVLKRLDNSFGISGGSITTVHPWLNYQNVLDGQSKYQSNPKQTYHNYALGRSSSNNIIPKWTTALVATNRVLTGIEDKLLVFSYRTPHAIVGSADLTIILEKTVDKKEIKEIFLDAESEQTCKIFKNDIEPLVSTDFIKSPYSCHIDHRWTETKGNVLKLVLWYDNEFGYASRVVDQISLYQKLDIT